MEIKIVWSTRSKKDLAGIHQYIALDSIIYANRFIEKLISFAQKNLSTFPRIGKALPEYSNRPLNNIHEIYFNGYRVIYDHTSTQNIITILAVKHGRMQRGTQNI